ncbi:MAG: hypothetical protein EBQ94_08605 [Flavobacteriales bacterium]|jgi:hypothetical protein|nr:hypothetical protein [Crocinitomicaceae bacterium]NBX80420.1 hypothetical protein [Flavobacteriales bacterium]NCA19999.1 hypothetical protein [Crocinitomicaceae bacterium]
MKTFIKVTQLPGTKDETIYISKYQIVYLEADERHSQTFIYCTNKEFTVIETIDQILSQID